MKSIVLFFLFCLPLSIFAQNRSNIENQIKKIIYYDEQLNFEETKDILIGIIVKDSTYIFHFGEETIINDSSLFEIGGISKIFMATLVHKLEDEGLLKLSDTIDFENIHQFHPTIAMLLSHQAGFSKIPDDLGRYEKDIHDPYAFYKPTYLKQFYKNFQPMAPPKKRKTRKEHSKYTYSHIDYSLLSYYIEKTFTTEYNSLLTDNIFIPLGLTDTKMELSNQEKSRFVQGYSVFGKKQIMGHFNAFKGATGLKSSMRDLLKFTRSNIGLENHSFSTIFDTMQIPVTKTGVTKNAFMANGWHIIKKKKYYNICAHVGVTKGHSSIIAFVPETQTGVVVLSTSAKKFNNLAFLILRMLNFNWKKK